jgi:putative heme iron utilization protein
MEPAAEARHLVRGLDRAALATSMEGTPYASLVLVATAPDGAPLLLLSRLAQHTQNLDREGRASLLFDGTAGLDEPLTGPRVTIVGEARRVDDASLKARFVRRHPSAELYASFADFGLFRLEPQRGHIVAGFGRIHWVERDGLVAPSAPRLEAAEEEIVAHMNEDHGEAVQLYARRLCGRSGETWRMTGIDPDGLDLRRGGEVARLPFSGRVETPQEARAELVRLAKAARER